MSNEYGFIPRLIVGFVVTLLFFGYIYITKGDEIRGKVNDGSVTKEIVTQK